MKALKISVWQVRMSPYHQKQDFQCRHQHFQAIPDMSGLLYAPHVNNAVHEFESNC